MWTYLVWRSTNAGTYERFGAFKPFRLPRQVAKQCCVWGEVMKKAVVQLYSRKTFVPCLANNRIDRDAPDQHFSECTPKGGGDGAMLPRPLGNGFS